MHTFHQQLTEALPIAKEAYGKLIAIFAGTNLEAAATKGLKKDIAFISANINGEGLPGNDGAGAVGELTKMFGENIGGETGQSTETADDGEPQLPIPNKTPQQIQAEELQAEVDQLWENLKTLETDKILDSYSELAIRGCGKKAGLPVTESSPKKVDAKFIGQILEAIAQQEKIAAGANNG